MLSPDQEESRAAAPEIQALLHHREDGQMQDILRRISNVPGVLGAFVCSNEGDVLASAFTDPIAPHQLSTVCRTITQTLDVLHTAKHARVSNLDLLYAKGRLLIKRLPRGALVMVCVRTVNIPLLSLTSETAAKALIPLLKITAPPAPRVRTEGIPVTALSAVARDVLGPTGERVLEGLLKKQGHTAEILTGEELLAVLPQLESSFAVFVGSARARSAVEAMRRLSVPA